MRISSFPFSLECLQGCLCIDKIPKLAKTKSQKPKEIFFIKFKTRPRPPKTAHSNTPPHVYVTVWEDLHNTTQMYMQRKKAELLFLQ